MKLTFKTKNHSNTPTTSFSLSCRNKLWAAPHTAILKKRIRSAALPIPGVFEKNVGQTNYKNL